MKRIALAATMALALAGTAKADWIDYWGFGGGATQSPDLGLGATTREMDFGYNVGGFVGWNQSEDVSIVADVWLVESEYEPTSASIQTISAMVNGVFRFDLCDWVDPYIAGGAGGVNVRYSGGNLTPTISGAEWAFGWQAGAGLIFPIDDNNSITLGYRYQASEDVTVETLNDIEYQSHSISIGFAFN